MTTEQIAKEILFKLQSEDEKLKQLRSISTVEVGVLMRAMRMMSPRKISLRECARKMGCSAPFLSDMEKGRRTQSIEWIDKLERVLK